MNEQTARILIVEDLDSDAELIEHELRKARINFSMSRVETEKDFLTALAEFRPDVVLSDYNLPQFGGLQALGLLKANSYNAPFILITGSLTEEVAVECMKEGAYDYILKASLKRLPSAVINALTSRKTEEDKAKAEELYRLIAENTTDLICLLDAYGNYLYVSPSYEYVLGYAPENLLGRPYFALLQPKEQELARASFTQSRSGQQLEQTEWKFKHVDGTWKDFDVVVNWIHDGQSQPQRAIVVSRDLTERKQTESALRQSEEQLRQAQKLEAIGQLAGGVAHDFNNILTVITGYSDMLLKKTSDDHPHHNKILEIKRAADRASSLTRQLLAFSRKQVLQPKLFSVNILVSEMGNMLGRLIGEDIELVTSLTTEQAQINADPGQIEQVLMNLVVNARDAMPGGGKIAIETSIVEIDRNHSDMHIPITPGRNVMLAVSDNGSGMDEETRKHIFEPFYTTKELGKGTGLGLSTVYGIVKQSGGNIWVQSEPGKGTSFRIYLPLVDVEDTEQSRQTSVHPVGGGETILLVEDEPQIRGLAVEYLTECGYDILVASNGKEALRAIRGQNGPIDLIVTDVIMPQMSGRELAEQVAEISPTIKVLYMSGYTNDAILRHGVLESETWFIQKPFAPDALASKVREVLDSPQLVAGKEPVAQHHGP